VYEPDPSEQPRRKRRRATTPRADKARADKTRADKPRADKAAEPPEVKPASFELLMERAFRLLTARARSVGELRARLSERGDAAPELVERALARLAELDYLDDARFAREYGAYKVRYGRIGRARLTQTLQRLHLSAEIIEAALPQIFAAHPEHEAVDELIQKRLRLRGDAAPNPVDIQKISDHLMRRGFSGDAVKDGLAPLWAQARQTRHEPAEERDLDQERADVEAFVEKHLRIKGTLKSFQDVRKLSDRLTRRGFDREVIKERLDALYQGLKKR
jgi:regulatory protein